MTITLTHISRYPVKGLSAQALSEVMLTPDQALPEDRRFAITHGASAFDSNEPAWQSKCHFVVPSRNPRLATLESEYDPPTTTLIIRRNGRPVARGQIGTALGRSLIDQFLAAYLKDDVPGVPHLIEAPDICFTDHREPFIALINAASLHDLERVVKEPVNPTRFRANLIITGAAPWQESTWPGKSLTLGSARLEVVEPITRCAAINIEPGTGKQSLNLLLALERGYTHHSFGVYCRVAVGGQVAVGDEVWVRD